MSELRWILLGLGILLIAVIYLWNRQPLARFRPVSRRPRAGATELSGEPTEIVEPAADKPKPRRRAPEKVVTLRVVARSEEEMSAEAAVLALKRCGFVHGRYGIFHLLPDDGTDEPLFSVASLTEPGSFDLAGLRESKIAGLSLFLVLPGVGDPVARFDSMIEFARDLAEELDGVLLDERGSSWSIQRERYIREEIIQYQHQLLRS